MVTRLLLACIVVTQSPTLGVVRADDDLDSQTESIGDMIVVLIDEVNLPAAVSGPLAEVRVGEGDSVESGTEIARIDDRQARLQHALAVQELEIAQEQRDYARDIDVAQAQLAEERQLAAEHEAKREVNRRKATSDLRVQAASKAAGVAENELKRAKQAREAFTDAVSESEIEGLQLAFERSQLETRQAQLDRQLDALSVIIDDAVAETFQLRIRSAEIALQQAESAQRIIGMQTKLEQQKVNVAELLVDQHQLRAPIAGVVVKIDRRLGDWVNAGESIARIIRLDRLRAEGYVPAARVDGLRQAGQLRVEITRADGSRITRSGDCSFFSPEVDPVTNETRIWVEFDNADLAVQPGFHARLLLADAITGS